jgi:cytochrome c
LPAGGGTAAEGRALYDRRCAACHGPTGQEGPDDRLAGGQGSLAGDGARKTVGSYWPAATTLWDYVNRAMPFNQPGSLAPDEVYAVVAYVLYLNDLVGEDDPVDAATLPRVEMPNRDGFVPDARPDVGVASGAARRSPAAAGGTVAAVAASESPAAARRPAAAAAEPAAPPAPVEPSAVAVAPSAGSPSAPSASASVLDGIFTPAQASRGERTFSDVCAACHDTGEFSGGRFRISWVGRPVGELFETISTLMPEADPGSLSPAEYAAIVAYLLQLNNYPAGDADLPTSVRALGQLEIVSPPAQ